MSLATHIALAQTEGAKAGFRHYMAQTVHTAAERRAEIRSAGNSKRQFEAYCAIFGDQFRPVSGNGAVRSQAQREDVSEDGALTLLRRAAEKLGFSVVKDEAVGVVVEAPAKTKAAPKVKESEVQAPERISWRMVQALMGRSKAWGESFEITDKDVDTITTQNGREIQVNDYHLTYTFEDGDVHEDITPEFASELIAEFKAA
jgi:hypothetical protein